MLKIFAHVESSFGGFHLIPAEGSKRTVCRSRVFWQQVLLLDSKPFMESFSCIFKRFNSTWGLSRLCSHHLHSCSLKILCRLNWVIIGVTKLTFHLLGISHLLTNSSFYSYIHSVKLVLICVWRWIGNLVTDS